MTDGPKYFDAWEGLGEKIQILYHAQLNYLGSNTGTGNVDEQARTYAESQVNEAYFGIIDYLRDECGVSHKLANTLANGLKKATENSAMNELSIMRKPFTYMLRELARGDRHTAGEPGSKEPRQIEDKKGRER